MNEQLVVKNFGPIKDATVDFKRVTVFIGPTGGGKSTLAKLAAIFRESKYLADSKAAPEVYIDFNLGDHFMPETYVRWEIGELNKVTSEYINGQIVQRIRTTRSSPLSSEALKKAMELQQSLLITNRALVQLKGMVEAIAQQRLPTTNLERIIAEIQDERRHALSTLGEFGMTEEQLAIYTQLTSHIPCYIPAERQIIPVLNQSWPDLLNSKVALPRILLNFVKMFLESSKEVTQLDIDFLGLTYLHNDGQNVIKLAGSGKILPLNETASGIQSVTPLLVLLEHLSRNTEQAQSFIIEEPELNLYPTAQQGLLNWLVEKCTKGENDLTITTHSPYILSHLNLLLYAFQVAEQHPDRAEDVAKVVPRANWINPKEFAAYHVEGQKEGGVHSIVNPETGLISYNGLDALAGSSADEFDKLLDISAGLEVE